MIGYGGRFALAAACARMGRVAQARALYDQTAARPAVDSRYYRFLRGLAEEALGITGTK